MVGRRCISCPNSGACALVFVGLAGLDQQLKQLVRIMWSGVVLDVCVGCWDMRFRVQMGSELMVQGLGSPVLCFGFEV